MSDNCPQCGFKLKDFYKQKIEDELRSDFEKQKKDQERSGMFGFF